jgi:short-subunit dehydrogenase
LSNKELVVVVGVGPGVGLGVAEAFAKKGHPLLLIARSESKLEDLAAGLRSTGVEVNVATADASVAGDVARVISAISTPISALVYNAAAFGGPLLTAGAEELRKASEVNLYSLISATDAARPSLKEAGGVVLVTGGGFALFPSADYGILSVGKAMVRSAAFILAQELKADGIRVATVTICGTVAPDTAFSPEKIAAAYIAVFENQNSEIETVFTGE